MGVDARGKTLRVLSAMVVGRQRAERIRLVDLSQLVVGTWCDAWTKWDLLEFIETGRLGVDAGGVESTPEVDEYVRAIRENGGVFLMPEEVKARGYNI